jgi:hypothetical protein
MTALTYQQLVEISPKMVMEIALGVREPEDIAAEHGFSLTQWEDLKVVPSFIKQVEDKKLELKSSGVTFKMKAAVAAEDIMEDVYLKAKEEDSSFHVQLEALKFFARAAGLEAPAKEQSQAGSGFSVVINLGGGKTVQIGTSQGNTIEHDEISVDYDSTEYFAPYEPSKLKELT